MTKEILARFESATHEFLNAARLVPAEKLEIAPDEGEWPPSYVIHHLADSDAQFLVRFINVLSMDRPAIVPFDESTFPGALDYPNRNIATSLTAIDSSCAHLVDILKNVNEAGWNRTGMHVERGELTLSALLELTTNHRIGHIDQISR